ncbi:MAG: hypothetical protein V3T17_00680, partial [Pseudomonadales bacterium]
MSSLKDDLASISTLPEAVFKDVLATISNPKNNSLKWAMVIDKAEEEIKESIKGLFRVLSYIADTFAETRNFKEESEELDKFMSSIAESDGDALDGWHRIRETFSELQNFFIKRKEDDIKSRFSRVTKVCVTVD